MGLAIRRPRAATWAAALLVTMLLVVALPDPAVAGYTQPGLRNADGSVHPVPAPNPRTGAQLNVVHHGARTAADSADDAAAIRRALAAARFGDEVYLPDGTYDLRTTAGVGDTHFYLRDGVNLRGQSRDGVRLVSYPDGDGRWVDAMRASGVKDATLSDFTITSSWNGAYSDDVGQNNPDRGGPRFGIYIKLSSQTGPSARVTVEDVLVEEFQKAGVQIERSHDVVVRRAVFRNATDLGGGGAGYGVAIDGVPGTSKAEADWGDAYFNVVEDSGFYGTHLRHGVLIQYNAHNNLVRRNVFDRVQLDSIDLHGEGEYLNEVTGNEVRSTLREGAVGVGSTGGGPGIYWHGASGAGNHIHHNTLRDSVYGVRVHMGSPGTRIESNTIENLTTSTRRYAFGVLVENGPGTVITGNRIRNFKGEGAWGVRLRADPGECQPSPCSAPVGAGVPRSVRVTGNTVTDNAGGILVTAGESLTLYPNTMSGNRVDVSDVRPSP